LLVVQLPTMATLTVNSERYEVDASDGRRLVDVLRDDLGLLGTKLACGEGACGACAVLVDGAPVASCILLAAAAEGHEVVTIEGLASGAAATLVDAFVAEDALQCGFCTPGQIVSASALLARTPRPTPEDIRTAMAGNLCRCGAYPKIERAILRAAAGQQ
jgi:aerobic-type carbon monoxide dehydrogenase small subunit (CoxS/CutS family)